MVVMRRGKGDGYENLGKTWKILRLDKHLATASADRNVIEFPLNNSASKLLQVYVGLIFCSPEKKDFWNETMYHFGAPASFRYNGTDTHAFALSLAS